jgi:hypothetical protein
MGDDKDARLRACRALTHAAEQVGANNYRSGLYRPTYRRGKLVRGYTLTPEHRALVEAMPGVLSGAMGIEEAMALLHTPETFRQRFGG